MSAEPATTAPKADAGMPAPDVPAPSELIEAPLPSHASPEQKAAHQFPDGGGSGARRPIAPAWTCAVTNVPWRNVPAAQHPLRSNRA